MSLRFITDEDVPRSTARILRDASFDAVDVRDIGLRGKSDAEVFDLEFWSSEFQIASRLIFSIEKCFTRFKKWEII
ncbi:MAG: hypothetical protein DPW18_00915 [Chloroflexi bacterium]|nr:hypothetical protein [Chloroflexota bacterium]MDL1941370.1 hypothetical protein [Chloroflexi bacterium CFX2]